MPDPKDSNNVRKRYSARKRRTLKVVTAILFIVGIFLVLLGAIGLYQLDIGEYNNLFCGFMICFGGAAIFGGCIILRKYFVHVAEDKDTREQAAAIALIAEGGGITSQQAKSHHTSC